MVIRICAWHPDYFGEPLELGRVDDGRAETLTTHGICDECQIRFRAAHFVPPRGRELVAEARRQLARRDHAQ
jgi:hypothetical protein